MEDFSFDVHIFKEGNTYVASFPRSTCRAAAQPTTKRGGTFRDAVRGFLASSADMGTLDEILQEVSRRTRQFRCLIPGS